jgi:hypothetical protein
VDVAIDVGLWAVAGAVLLGGVLIAAVAMVRGLRARRAGRPID